MPFPPILVSSTSDFADCWEPFDLLLRRYWPTHPVAHLITEKVPRKVPPSLNPLVTDVPARPSAWSEGMLRAVTEVGAPYFLYMQEDYFLTRLVDVSVLEQAYRLMSNEGFSCLRVRETMNSGPWIPTDFGIGSVGDVWRVDDSSPYLCSLQAAFWRTSDFVQLLEEGESPWQFEVNGSRRLREAEAKAYCLSIDDFRGPFEPLPYLATGIVRGKWHPDTPQLFEREGLEGSLGTRPVMQRSELDGDNSGWARARRLLKRRHL